MTRAPAIPCARPRAWAVLVLLLAGLLPACEPKPTYPDLKGDLRIETTISSDGKMLAVLDRTGEETRRLRLKRLDPDGPWLEIPAPKYASSIRFALTGYELLLTHARPGPEGASQLSRWDASQPSKPSVIEFLGTRIAFPIEVKPGQVLVRTCPQPPGEKACVRGHGLVWSLVEAGKATPIKETLGLYPLGTPNVVEDGFFWNFYDDKLKSTTPVGVPLPRTKIYAYGFPGKQAPEFDTSMLDATTGSMECDRQAHRCLVSYLTPERYNGSRYVYGFKVLNGSSICTVPDIKGWQDDFSVTPDGRAAIISSARVSEEPRHLVLLRFKPGQCEPTSIQRIDFKEKQP